MAQKTVSEVAALAGVSVRTLQVGALNERIAALDEAIRKSLARTPLAEIDYTALFDGFDPKDFEAEAETHWGDTDAWQESQRRTRRYGEAEWRAIRDEQTALNAQLAELQQQGLAATDLRARRLAQEHRAHMDRWFYTVTPEVHLGLADLYVEDPRFRATYDKVSPGLAGFVREAIHALYAHRPKQL